MTRGRRAVFGSRSSLSRVRVGRKASRISLPHAVGAPIFTREHSRQSPRIWRKFKLFCGHWRKLDTT